MIPGFYILISEKLFLFQDIFAGGKPLSIYL